MSALPWLMVHGAAVYKGALALFLLAGLAFSSLRTRLTARREACAARRRLGPPVPLRGARVGARVTLEGRLEGEEEACLRYDGAASRKGRIAVGTGDETVRLDGPVEVAAGSREHWPGRFLSATEGPVFRSLSPGDRVLVSGVLGEEAVDEAPSYRDAGKRWTLGGAVVAAHAGHPRVIGPSAPARVPHVLVAGLLYVLAFGAVGEVAMRVAKAELMDHVSGSERKLTGAAVAAATPFRRADALAGIVSALDMWDDPEPAVLDARAALHELRGERAAAAELWITHGEPEHGAALAESSGNPALAARGWYLAGEFERAAAAWARGADRDVDDLRFGLGVQLFAGQLDRAAGTATRLAAALRAHRADNDRLRRLYATRAEMVDCLALALDARRGGAEAWSRLHAPRSEPIHPACAALRIDLFDGAERLQAIRLLPPLARDAHEVPREWLALLAAEVAPYGGEDDISAPFESAAEVAAIPNGEPVARMIPGVERHLAEVVSRLPPPLVERRRPRWSPPWASAAATMFAFLAGDEDEAQLLARMTEAAYAPLVEAGFSHMGPSPVEITAVTSLLSDRRLALGLVDAGGEGSGFLHGLVDVTVERDAGPMLAALARRPPPDLDEKRAWSFAAAGDGEALAHWLRRPLSQPGTFLRFGAPRIRTGARSLLRAVLYGGRPLPGFRPTEEVVHLANRTATVEALTPGSALGAQLRERTRRFREAILRRETAVPLAVIERL